MTVQGSWDVVICSVGQKIAELILSIGGHGDVADRNLGERAALDTESDQVAQAPIRMHRHVLIIR